MFPYHGDQYATSETRMHWLQLISGTDFELFFQITSIFQIKSKSSSHLHCCFCLRF